MVINLKEKERDLYMVSISEYKCLLNVVGLDMRLYKHIHIHKGM